jgi:hypothetical protein
MGEGELEPFLPSPKFGRGDGGEGAQVYVHSLGCSLNRSHPYSLLLLKALDFTFRYIVDKIPPILKAKSIKIAVNIRAIQV